jgi:hypothetical protein
LLFEKPEAMRHLKITFRVVALVSWAGLVLVGREVWSAPALPLHAAALEAPAASAAVSDLLERLETQQEQIQPQMDLYGNEIEEAVGDYRIDPQGDVYERHSPETEVVALGPPVI